MKENVKVETQIVLEINTIVAVAKLITSLGVIAALLWNIFRQYQKWESYDKKITDTNKRIDDLQTEVGAKMQQIQAEQCMQTYVLQAVLDGLHQLNCNGEVTKASEKLNKYINKKAHSQDDGE